MSTSALTDLHLHSDQSDGRLTPAALVALAAAQGVRHLALTDHDTVAGLDHAAAACAAAGLRFTPGVEATALWRGQSIHVIGLGLQPDEPVLSAHLAGLRQHRRQRLLAIGERLARRARLPDAPAIAARIGAETAVPTRTHLARALVEAGAATDLANAFRRLLGHGGPGHLPEDWPALEATVAVLRGAGAQVVLAHPHRYRLSGGALRALTGEFAAHGGHALEVSLGNMARADLDRLAALARRHGLAASCGSDFHDPAMPWNTPGRFAKLPTDLEPVSGRL
ncbi:MAG: PHP domain-containing protein [Steroidobacteraceae bacterium]|nr:PHP domain-containing protein [Nevskiaceae bacterium]MCP5466136.1 PHP domain-containing protein [Nevskiaceae bacterium]MCP5471538.1 PHP domain-containing protein [Nevskiaceae bacterium]